MIGEYTGGRGTVVPVAAHPAIGDDDAHLQNYLRKDRLATAVPGLVYLDRDWLSVLAYAHSIGDTGLLATRSDWVWAHLRAGDLAVADVYVVLHCAVETSLARRADRLRPGHPWHRPAALRALAVFYRDPAACIAPVHPGVAAALTRARWHHLHDPTFEQAARMLTELFHAAGSVAVR
ncbi:hypothetical protein [Nocardia terpenica]|uniref:hypothetical protein n=1 Tax=Nocardia terpenica TaxID=455432 RepID=UPI002FE3C5D3